MSTQTVAIPLPHNAFSCQGDNRLLSQEYVAYNYVEEVSRQPASYPSPGDFLSPDTLEDAIVIPAAFAKKVHAEMKISLLAGPVVGHPSSSQWIFLTDASGQASAIPDELKECNMQVLSLNLMIFLAQKENFRHWRWIRRPVKDRPLPPQSALIAVAKRVAYRENITTFC